MGWRRAEEPVAASAVLARCGEAEDVGRTLALVIATARWQQVAGAMVVGHTAVVSFEAGLLTVGVPNQAWVSRLQREQSHLLAAFAGAPHGERVRRLRFVVVPVEEIVRRSAAVTAPSRPGGGRRRPGGEPPPLSATDERALAPLADGDELRPLFESWMRHVRRRRQGPPGTTGAGAGRT